MPECNYVHRKRVDRISIERSHHEERLSFWGIMACAVCHKPTTTGLRSVLHPVSRSNSDQRHFFLKFVSPGYQWPDCTLYVCRSTCLSKLQQGVAKAADLRKIVNDLRVQHAPISSQAEIHMTMSEDPACETLVSDSGMDSADVANLTHQSQLGKRKVPCEPPYTPEINKMPKIITDGPERMPRRRLSYGTPPASATEGSTPQSVIKVKMMEVELS